jgi:HprK-related kinase A
MGSRTWNSSSAAQLMPPTAHPLRLSPLIGMHRAKPSAWAAEVGAGVFRYRAGPFVVQLRTGIRALQRLLRWCYGRAEAPPADAFVHLNLRVDRGPLYRRLLAPQAVFRFEHRTPFEPYPEDHAFPLLEWGTNWCIAERGHRFLMLHAGVLERGGRALILPALPGSGKTTLTAALAFRGWRFLSDEFALVDGDRGLIHPLPRAAPLKNRSIEVIRAFAPEAEIGPVFERTRKGDVAHLRPPADALARQLEPAEPAWILFPRFIAGQALRVQRLSHEIAFTRLAQNSFNYRLLGVVGFERLTGMVRRCACFSATYGDLEAIVAAVDRLLPAAEH